MKKGLIILISFLMLGCATSKYSSKLADSKKEISEISIIAPSCILHKIQFKNTVIDTIGSQENVANLSIAFDSLLRTATKTSILEIQNDLPFDEEIVQLMQDLLSAKYVKNVKIGPNIETKLHEDSSRFYALIHQSGFTRTGGSYARDVGLAILIGVATLGSFYTAPIPSSSHIYFTIYDKLNSEFIYFDHNYAENNPKNRKLIGKQGAKILKRYVTL